MADVRVIYHHEDGLWWAESPTIAGLVASGASLSEVRSLVREGLAFYLEGDVEVDLLEDRADGNPVFSFDLFSNSVAIAQTAATRSQPAASPVIDRMPMPEFLSPRLSA